MGHLERPSSFGGVHLRKGNEQDIKEGRGGFFICYCHWIPYVCIYMCGISGLEAWVQGFIAGLYICPLTSDTTVAPVRDAMACFCHVGYGGSYLVVSPHG